ncbi:MAG: FAD-binding protein, partial [Odoribacter sp.]|nr:FAD-binding protein [Odoribacter sp.]
MEVKENYSLQNYNTFAIAVKCKYFAEVGTEEELLDFVRTYEWNPEEILILGGGSNFLFTEDFDGTVFYPVMKGMEVVKEDGDFAYVRVGAGEVWDDFVAWAVEMGYGGVENLSLIPGHV